MSTASIPSCFISIFHSHTEKHQRIAETFPCRFLRMDKLLIRISSF